MGIRRECVCWSEKWVRCGRGDAKRCEANHERRCSHNTHSNNDVTPAYDFPLFPLAALSTVTHCSSRQLQFCGTFGQLANKGWGCPQGALVELTHLRCSFQHGSGHKAHEYMVSVVLRCLCACCAAHWCQARCDTCSTIC